MDSARARSVGLILVFLLAGTLNCGSDKETNPPTDTAPPAAVFDLAAETTDGSSVRLSWTAPGDDDWVGTAASYEIRYAATAINDSTWNRATPIAGAPIPAVVGSRESFDATALQPGTIYHFGLKSADEALNWSACSNSARSATLGDDRTPPARILDFVADSATTSSITLAWTAPGDDGADGRGFEYDIRVSPEPISEANFAEAQPSTGAPLPDSSGSAERFTVAGLEEDTLYYFAIKTLDELLNTSGISNQASSRTLLRDVTPPAAVQDLRADFPLARSIALYWTSPGDDSSSGTASVYDIRYAEEAIDHRNWNEAIQVEDEPEPEAAGAKQGYRVEGLAPNRDYFFSIKTADDWMNWSALSNIAGGKTLDIYPPEAVTDLTVENPTGCVIDLSWTAPADDSVEAVTAYDVRFATFPIDEESWDRAWSMSPFIPEPTDPGVLERIVLSGFARGATFSFALRSRDEADNDSPLSNVQSVEMPPAIGSDANWSTEIAGEYGWRSVTDMTTYEGDLIATGTSRGSGGSTRQTVERWTGTRWEAIGPWVSEPYAVEVYEGELYVGGDFREIAGHPVLGIARWDPDEWRWQPVGSGVNGAVYTLLAHDGELYAAGQFSRAGRINGVRNIARWDGGRWDRVGPGLGIEDYLGPPHVLALTVWNGRIVAGGRFREYGNVAYWTGNSWRPAGGGVIADVAALTVLDGELVVGGGGLDEPPLLARWDGSQWKTFGLKITGNVLGLAVYHNRLITAGLQTEAGGSPAHGIAAWDGTCWSRMGSGITLGGGRSLHVLNGRLYVGGNVREAGGDPVYGIAAWED